MYGRTVFVFGRTKGQYETNEKDKNNSIIPGEGDYYSYRRNARVERSVVFDFINRSKANAR